jgi:GTP cyclohydrolase I
MQTPTLEEALIAVRTLIRYAGDDPDRDGLLDTPSRVVKSYAELFSGYQLDPKHHLSKTFDESTDEMVMVTDISFSSTCEHHMLPFMGVAHIAYLPGTRVVGLSKFARLVDGYARRLQIQERLTKQIADAILEMTECSGVAVVLDAHHQCMSCRGAKQHGARMRTQSLHGSFRTDDKLRNEFMLALP